MKKKVVVLILALFMLMPVSGVFASDFDYTSGYLDTDWHNVKNHNLPDSVYDNNLDTGYSFSISGGGRRTFFVEFENVVDVTHHMYLTNKGGSAGYVKFYNDDGGHMYQSTSNIDYIEINLKNVYKIEIDIFTSTNGTLRMLEFDFFGSVSSENINLMEINNIRTEQIMNSFLFSYDLPENDDFDYINLYKDDELVQSNIKENELVIKDLIYQKDYKIKITTVDVRGNESFGIEKTIRLEDPELEEIQQVNAEASHDRIDLSWSLPDTEYFEHVNIYRKNVSEVQTFSLLSTDEYDPLFETNGTYFNDLTVEEQTTYDYKLTTEFQGLESEGVTVQATTLAAPPPELGGQEFEEQANGDYLVTWQQPETGQVRILVDGQEYVVVPATDKQYTIPASDMKYSALGDPLVGLQTIGDNGEESEVEQQESNVNLPFGINELLTTSAGLLRVIGSLILLGLSFILVPKFIKVIKQSLNNKKNAETDRAYREPRESRISTREGRTSTRVPRNYRKGE